ncbi:MAG TPA: type II toxin-antitoxin system VapC family toxin [Sporichthyaceae bacterium]
MSVLDASLLTDALIGAGQQGDAAVARVTATSAWHAPHLLPAEVASAVRGLLAAGQISSPVAAAALDRLRQTRIRLHAFDPFAERVWELRANATVYDAWYIALAERLDVALVTRDPKLQNVPGVRCPVEVVP